LQFSLVTSGTEIDTSESQFKSQSLRVIALRVTFSWAWVCN